MNDYGSAFSKSESLLTGDSGNLLLNSLPDQIRSQIIYRGKLVEVSRQKVLEDSGSRPNHVYFLNEGLASVVVASDQNEISEIAMIGSEGMTGASALLGWALPVTRTVMQVAGNAYQVPYPVVESLFQVSVEFRNGSLQFIQRQLLTTQQLAYCGQKHALVPRLARWLLMVQHRSGVDHVRMSHESLSDVLGVYRPTISVALRALTSAGLLLNDRRSIKIIDRAGLMAVACPCYPITRRLLIEEMRNTADPLLKPRADVLLS